MQKGKRTYYQVHKPSGAEWLGEIAKHWVVKRIKFVAKTIMGQSPNSDSYTFDDSCRPFLQGNAEFGPIHPSPKYYCDVAAKEAPKDSLLISVRAPVGALNIADQSYGIGRGLCAVVTKENLLLCKFAWYALTVTRNELWSIATGSTYEAVSADEVAAMKLVVPPLDEQQAIAAFLDREAARIDSLIEKKQWQIELLQEKRSALISHAVTKGLDPNVKMKDSGVEWLGDVPEQWPTVRLRFRAKVNPSKAELNGVPEMHQVSFIPMEAVHEYGGLSLDQTRPLSEVGTGYTYFREGDVLTAKITPCFENGKGSIAVGLLNGIGFGTTELHVLRPCSELDRSFLFYVTISDAFRKLGAADMYGAGGQKRVPDDFVKDFRQPMPPLIEQLAIAAFLDRETARIETLVEKVQESIEKLREYRTALISAAVTGKIDLRKEVLV